MSFLTTSALEGIWAGLPVPWTESNEIDESALRENVRRVCRAGAHGVYTHGTTGEFYAQTPEEWRRVVIATIEEAKPYGTPVQIGCTSLWTQEVIRRAAYALDAGAAAIQIAFPFWLPLTDDQSLRFLKEVTMAVSAMPVVIYNTAQSKKTLTAGLLKRIMDAGIPVIGCKGVRSTDELASLHGAAPELRFFVGEADLAGWWKYGARGCYSSLVYACPRLILHYYEMCRRRDPEAERIAQALKRIISEYVIPRIERGMYDTAFDRVFAMATEFLTGSLLLSRGPYDSPTQKDVLEFRDWCARCFPEFIQEV